MDLISDMDEHHYYMNTIMIEFGLDLHYFISKHYTTKYERLGFLTVDLSDEYGLVISIMDAVC